MQARHGQASPDICGCWLPVWLPEKKRVPGKDERTGAEQCDERDQRPALVATGGVSVRRPPTVAGPRRALADLDVNVEASEQSHEGSPIVLGPIANHFRQSALEVGPVPGEPGEPVLGRP